MSSDLARTSDFILVVAEWCIPRINNQLPFYFQLYQHATPTEVRIIRDRGLVRCGEGKCKYWDLVWVLCYNYKNSKMENSSGDLNKVLSNPSHSKYSKSQTSSHPDLADPKRRYAAVIQQEKHQERAQLHQKLEKKKQQQQKAHRKHLQSEITKRKKELQHLEREKQSGIEENQRATHLAELKKEKDAIKKMQQSVRAKTVDAKSHARYKQAKQRQKQLDKKRNAKRTQADQLRKTHLETEAIQRAQAAKFNQSLLNKINRQQLRKEEAQKEETESYRKGLSLHGFSQKLFDKEIPIALVFKESEEQGEAMTRTQQQKMRNAEREKLRQQVHAKNRKIAEERGNQVSMKLQRQREYQAYCKEAEQEQRKYNLRRLQAGKNNQYAGVKPITLSQIDLNKKLRSQKQFEQMFIKGPSSQKQHPVGKYKVIENKMVDVVENPQPVEKWVKKPINYADSESLIPGVSEGHYSFQSEQSDPEEAPASAEKKEVQIKQVVKPIMKETGIPQPVDSTGKTRLKQTRLSNEPPKYKQELDYSDSEEDSNI